MVDAAAFVGSRPVPVALVEERLAALRSGPYAARLPHPHSAEGRNLRRWIVQALATEAVIEQEAQARSIVADAHDVRRGQPLTLASALQSGGVTAAIVAALPLARALRRRVIGPGTVSETVALAYYTRNSDRFAQPYDQVRAELVAELGRADRDRRFMLWLDQRCAALIRLQPGYEHPGDPRHSDAVHRH